MLKGKLVKRIISGGKASAVPGTEVSQDATDPNELRKRIVDLEEANELLLERLGAVQFSEQQALKCLRRMQHASVRNSMMTIDRSVEGRPSTIMKTIGVIGKIYPGEVYRTHLENLKMVQDEERESVTVFTLPTPVTPEKLTIKNGFTDSPANFGEAAANVLGGNLVFITERESISIPEVDPTPEHFAYYGCYLVPLESNVAFETPQVVPFTIMTVGER
jgi:hypothetical protein